MCFGMSLKECIQHSNVGIHVHAHGTKTYNRIVNCMLHVTWMHNSSFAKARHIPNACTRTQTHHQLLHLQLYP